VRELENVVERAFALGMGEVMQEADLPPHVVRGLPELSSVPATEPSVRADGGSSADLRSQRDAAERRAILRALHEVAGDKLAAAQRLGMSRSTFYRRLKELGL
jgi:DNA-binding NtrC family response regulator